MRRAVPGLLIVLLGLLLWPQIGWASTRLGLHVTQEELNCWRQRSGVAPPNSLTPHCTVKYKTLSDVATNSPGDWDRIVANKDVFINSTPSVWSGPIGCTCCNQFQNDSPTGGAEIARDAAFYALIAQDSSVKATVKSWLLDSIAPAQLDFTNRTIWCEGAGQNSENVFTTAEFVIRILYAVDYLDALDSNTFSGSEKTSLQNWFLGFADFTNTNLDIGLNDYFVDRPNNDYTWSSCPSTIYGGTPFYGGALFHCIHRTYNNRKATVTNAIANIAVKYHSPAYIGSVKKIAKEFLYFGIFSGEYASDFLRWEDTGEGGNPDRGLNYAAVIVEEIVAIADTLARSGDTELYTFSSNVGFEESAGPPPKSTLFALTMIAHYYDHTIDRYGTGLLANVGDALYRIDDRSIDTPKIWIHGVGLSRGNLYYQSTYLQSVYMRTASGTVGYPTAANIPGSTYSVWMGPNGLYPGMLFMWGQLEGAVNPYDVSGLPPASPTRFFE